jgi:hypothetical protein
MDEKDVDETWYVNYPTYLLTYGASGGVVIKALRY